MTKTSDDKPYQRRVSRRAFIAAAGGGAPLAASAAAAVLFSESAAHAAGRWDHEADVVVVGTGAAGTAAALFAHEEGAKVLMLEKASFYGGTTALSGGIYWVPNNSVMRSMGLKDERDDAVRFMARTAYPDQYQSASPTLGLARNEFDLLGAFYDEGSATLDKLEAMGCLQYGLWTDWTGAGYPDYYSGIPEDKAPRGRALACKSREDGKIVSRGAELIGQMKAGVDKRAIPVLMRRRATRLVLNKKREIIGLEATTHEGKTVTIGARRGVVFGSGGFTHNRELRNQLKGPIFSGCGPVTNEGDFVAIGGAVGAKLNNMQNAWWYPQILELALKTTATGLSGGNSSGDSMIIVNRYGDRVQNEKVRYPDRTQAHFHWDEGRGEYRNLVLFMIFDQRVREVFAKDTPIPTLEATPTWLLSAPSLEALAKVIDDRLAEHGDRLNVRLDKNFTPRLKETIQRFNGFAETGVDLDFGRGYGLHEIAAHGPRREGNDKPCALMYPLSDKGPYYAIMLCAGTLETKGGPKINPKAQVLDWSDAPIPGLYGAGNCIGSPAGAAYWGAGGTIGPAMVYGRIAGRNAAREPVKPLDL
jgi:succinate dehydrogenase/fumarate reductase flavoprotein subunit